MNSANAQNTRERAQDLLSRGLISVGEANVMMIRGEGVRLIVNRIPRAIRTALNRAVKAGELGHLPRDGHKPEAYFLPQAINRAHEMRRAEDEKVRAVSRTVMAQRLGPALPVHRENSQ